MMIKNPTKGVHYWTPIFRFTYKKRKKLNENERAVCSGFFLLFYSHRPLLCATCVHYCYFFLIFIFFIFFNGPLSSSSSLFAVVCCSPGFIINGENLFITLLGSEVSELQPSGRSLNSHFISFLSLLFWCWCFF